MKLEFFGSWGAFAAFVFCFTFACLSFLCSYYSISCLVSCGTFSQTDKISHITTLPQKETQVIVQWPLLRNNTILYSHKLTIVGSCNIVPITTITACLHLSDLLLRRPRPLQHGWINTKTATLDLD